MTAFGFFFFFGRRLSAWHILTWQSLPALPCKSAPNLSDCEVISCAQPSSGRPTDFQLDSGPGSGRAIPKLQSSSGEAIDLLIWRYALGRCRAEG